MSMMNNFQHKDGTVSGLQNPLDNSMKLPQQNQQQQQYYQNQSQNQANNLFQELLKLQAGQFMSTPSPQTPPAGAPSFGQGFMNAAQILATIQQLPSTP